MRTRQEKTVRNDLARLVRARLVVASESAEGQRLDEATVKAVTGRSRVPVRFLYQEFFEYLPQFKVWVVTNHRPRVEGNDDAIWRRLRLVPFAVSFIGYEDAGLSAKLDAEQQGILAWAVRGCLEWQRDGLGAPTAVMEATNRYRAEEDVLGTFISERCELDERNEVETKTLRAAYEAFCQTLGEKPLHASVLGKRLAEPRYGIRRNRSVYVGISLLPCEGGEAREADWESPYT
jgi:putative DNA primase/helicase